MDQGQTRDKHIIVGAFYGPQAEMPNFTELHASLAKLKELFPNTHIYLKGDFNMSSIDWSNLSTNHMSSSGFMIQLIADFNLDQVNLETEK